MSQLKVNFGCGGNVLAGWKNHDADVPIEKRLPYNDNTVDFILAEHVCEHVSGPQFLRFLDECYRILKPGGTIRLCMPTIYVGLRVEHARDLILGHGHLAAYTPSLIEVFLWAAGFDKIVQTERKECDGHWKVIGKELDDAETCRVEAVK